MVLLFLIHQSEKQLLWRFLLEASLCMQVIILTREQGSIPHSQEIVSAGPLKGIATSFDGDATATDVTTANNKGTVTNGIIPSVATNGLLEQGSTLTTCSNDGCRAFIW